MKGPRPRSKADKIARGETRPSRVNYDEPKIPEADVRKPPEDLKGAGLRLWKHHATPMVKRGQLRETDMPFFARACRTAMDIEYWRREFALKNLDRSDRLAIQRTIDRLETLAMRQAAELGMTAVSRTRVKIIAKPLVDRPKHDKFFGRRKARVIDGGRGRVAP